MAKVEHLTSPENALLKEVRQAVSNGGLTRDGYCIAETVHLLEEALRSRCEIKAVLAAASAQPEIERRLNRAAELRLIVLPDALSARLSATESNQGVMALVRPPTWENDDLIRTRPLVVALDGVQDPGNAGAILRAAEAFEATGVIFLKGSVNPYNPKVVRASAGSVFRVPILTGQGLPEMGLNGLTMYAATPAAGPPASQADLARDCIIIIGNEGRGISPALFAQASPLHVPTAGVESLNAAMAASILLYEAARQRGIRR
jgi:RNA methyltransferase, TrmH family